MSFKVKRDRYGQESKREGKRVRAIYLGKTGITERAQRSTKLDKVAGARIDEINEKIKTLYAKGYGDRFIAKTLHKEDMLENPTGSIGGSGKPLGPNVIKTQRKRLGIDNRAQPPKEEKKDWEAIAANKQSSIDELNTILASTMDERDRYIKRLQDCREENYSRKYPSV